MSFCCKIPFLVLLCDVQERIISVNEDFCCGYSGKILILDPYRHNRVVLDRCTCLVLCVKVSVLDPFPIILINSDQHTHSVLNASTQSSRYYKVQNSSSKQVVRFIISFDAPLKSIQQFKTFQDFQKFCVLTRSQTLF